MVAYSPEALPNDLEDSHLISSEEPGSTHSLLPSAQTEGTKQSSTPQLSVPFPKSGSPATASLQRTPSSVHQTDFRSPPLDRQTSRGGMTNGNATPGPSNLHRARSSSGPAIPSRPDGPNFSSARKGTTPGRQLKQHTCTWDYGIQHLIRIPIGKTPTTPAPSSAGSGFSTPGKRPPAPVLGGGPFSESGIRLIIDQLPTPETVSTSANHPGAEVEEKMEPPESKAGTSGTTSHHLHPHLPHLHGHSNSNSTSTTTSPQKDGKSAAKRKPTGETTPFGQVDVDLAPFAGKGKTTRRFLLRGSRTNATVKLTVEMKWVGGEEYWAPWVLLLHLDICRLR